MVKPGLTVLQVIPELDAGGAERTTLEITQALVKAGCRSIVVSQGGRMEAELAELGGKLIRLPVKSKSPAKLWANRKALIDIIRREKVDIVHARSRAPAWSALWAARATGTHYVTTYHGAYGGTSAPKTLYNSVMARGEIVIANSYYIADHVKAVHGVPDEKLVVIQRGVDLESFDPAVIDSARVSALRAEHAPDGQRLAILPGRLTDWKGQKVLIEALSLLTREALVGTRFVMFGDAQGRDEYVADLKNAIGNSNIDEFVRISGHYTDMPALYAASDMVLAPSKRPEAFGRVAVEAQAMGKPVIASDHGGQRETVIPGETGWLVQPDNAASLSEAIRQWLEMSAEDLSGLSAAAQKWARNNFSTALLQEKTLAVYDRVMQEGPN